MTINEAKIIIKKYMEAHHIEESKQIAEALQLALNIMGAYGQVEWERNIAFSQLEDLGISLGQKIDGIYLTTEVFRDLLEYKLMYEELCK